MSKYRELTKVSSGYAKRMNLLSAQIFGELTRPSSKSDKIVKMLSEKPLDKNPDIYQYYPRHPEIGWLMRCLRFYGLFRDEHQDFRDEIERTRILRGKKPKRRYQGPPKDKPA